MITIIFVVKRLNEEVVAQLVIILHALQTWKKKIEYKYSVGTRHVDPESGYTYEITSRKVMPNNNKRT